MNTLFIGQKAFRFKELKSTNAFLKSQIQSGLLPEGVTVSANHQTSGRGQFGNQWEDQPGQNLLISVYLKPGFLHVRHSFLLNMSVCLALHDFFSAFAEGFQIKWPNDIIRNGKKYCGVLIENQVSGHLWESAVVGMGLNINQNTFASAGASSLALHLGTSVDLAAAESQLLEALEKRYLQLRKPANRSAIKAEYLSKLYGYGQEIPIEDNGRKQWLKVTNVSDDGYLEVLKQDQSLARYAFKEIRFLLNA